MGFLTIKKKCFKSQAMAMKRVNFIVKIDNWRHITKLLKYLKICFHPFSANVVVNLYQVWEHFYFEPGLFVYLFVHLFSRTRNIGHVNYRLQFIYYNITYNIWTSTQYNVINNNTKFKDQLEVVYVTANRNMCIPTS